MRNEPVHPGTTRTRCFNPHQPAHPPAAGGSLPAAMNGHQPGGQVGTNLAQGEATHLVRVEATRPDPAGTNSPGGTATHPAQVDATNPARQAATNPAPTRGGSDDRVKQKTQETADRYRDILGDTATAIVVGTAAFSSWSGWVLLGRYAKWPEFTIPGPPGADVVFETAWLNPISVDVLAFIGLRAWTSQDLSDKTRRWGQVAAIGALILSVVANAVGHALEATDQITGQGGGFGRLAASVALAAMAPVILFVVLHLRRLRSIDAQNAVDAARKKEEDRVAREAARAARLEAVRTNPPTRGDTNPPARQEATRSTGDRKSRAGRRTRTTHPEQVGNQPARGGDNQPAHQPARRGDDQPDRDGQVDVTGMTDDDLIRVAIDLSIREGRPIGSAYLRGHTYWVDETGQVRRLGGSRADRIIQAAKTHPDNPFREAT